MGVISNKVAKQLLYNLKHIKEITNNLYIVNS